MLDRYERLTYDCQLKIGYEDTIQNGILKKILSSMGLTIVDIDIEIEMKISRINYLGSRLF